MLRSMLSPEQRQTLKSAKRLPLALLLLMALGFVASSVAAAHWQQVTGSILGAPMEISMP